jgi:hypothetical protein
LVFEGRATFGGSPKLGLVFNLGTGKSLSSLLGYFYGNPNKKPNNAIAEGLLKAASQGVR